MYVPSGIVPTSTEPRIRATEVTTTSRRGRRTRSTGRTGPPGAARRPRRPSGHLRPEPGDDEVDGVRGHDEQQEHIHHGHWISPRSRQGTPNPSVEEMSRPALEGCEI